MSPDPPTGGGCAYLSSTWAQARDSARRGQRSRHVVEVLLRIDAVQAARSHEAEDGRGALGASCCRRTSGFCGPR